MGQTAWLLAALAFIFFGGFFVQIMAKPWGIDALVVSGFYTLAGVVIMYGLAEAPNPPIVPLVLLALLIHFLGRITLKVAARVTTSARNAIG